MRSPAVLMQRQQFGKPLNKQQLAFMMPVATDIGKAKLLLYKAPCARRRSALLIPAHAKLTCTDTA